MGDSEHVDADRFPKQGTFLGRAVDVCFDYDTSRTFAGVVVRDDADEPGMMLIALCDGRFVRSTECQYSTSGGVIAPQLRALLPLINWLRSRVPAP